MLATVLLAASGAATALDGALAELLRVLRPALGLVVGEEGRDGPAAAGISPSTVPVMQPMNCGRSSRRMSAGEGITTLTETDWVPTPGLPDWRSSSLTAKSATITISGLNPFSRSGWPKVKRSTPERGSMPMVATIIPTQRRREPFPSSDPPDSEAMILRAQNPERTIGHGLERERDARQGLGEPINMTRPNTSRSRPTRARFPAPRPPCPAASSRSRRPRSPRPSWCRRADEDSRDRAAILGADIDGREQDDGRSMGAIP